MTLDQIKEVVALYRASFVRQGVVTAQKYSEEEVVNHHGRYLHLLYMCDEILAGNVQGEKAHRWLGFLQGVLWDDGKFTIGQMKDHNR